MNCPTCGTAMRPLLTGEFCPNDCDRPRVDSEESSPCTLAPYGWVCTRESGHDGPCAAWEIFSVNTEHGFFVARREFPGASFQFHQSGLWNDLGPTTRARVLACPFCREPIVCGKEVDRVYSGSCKGPDCHKVCVYRDERY